MSDFTYNKMKNIEDFCSSYNEIKPKIDRANKLSQQQYSLKLYNEINNSIDSFNINTDGDQAITIFNNAINELKSDFSLLNSEVKKYIGIEKAYETMKNLINELENEYDTYKKEYDAYKKNSNTLKYLDNAVYNTKMSWEEYIKTYEDKLVKIGDSINELKNKIKKFSELDLFNEESDFQFYYSNLQFSTDTKTKTIILTGEERNKFLSDNNIPNKDYISVSKTYFIINGVEFPVYKVYDTACSASENEKFENYINKCLKYESYIDSSVLSRIANSGTSLIFEQTYRCDGGCAQLGYFNSSAYCNSINRNIVQFYHEDTNTDYYSKSIVHETGHAYDFTLRYESTNETTCGITGITTKDIKSGKISTSQANELFTTDKKENYLTWDTIIGEEVNYFDQTHSSSSPCQIGQFSTEEKARNYYQKYCINGNLEKIEKLTDSKGNTYYSLRVSYQNTKSGDGVTISGYSSVYDIHNYVQSKHEYFADAFQAYFIGDKVKNSETSKLEYLCPKTYNAIDSLVKNEKKNNK